MITQVLFDDDMTNPELYDIVDWVYHTGSGFIIWGNGHGSERIFSPLGWESMIGGVNQFTVEFNVNLVAPLDPEQNYGYAVFACPNNTSGYQFNVFCQYVSGVGTYQFVLVNGENPYGVFATDLDIGKDVKWRMECDNTTGKMNLYKNDVHLGEFNVIPNTYRGIKFGLSVNEGTRIFRVNPRFRIGLGLGSFEDDGYKCATVYAGSQDYPTIYYDTNNSEWVLNTSEEVGRAGNAETNNRWSVIGMPRREVSYERYS